MKEYPDTKDPFILNIIETQKKLAEILKAFEIEEFDPTGKEFDPNTQESLLQIPVLPGCTANTVATTMRTGYTIQGRLLRSARVGIFQWNKMLKTVKMDCLLYLLYKVSKLKIMHIFFN